MQWRQKIIINLIILLVALQGIYSTKRFYMQLFQHKLLFGPLFGVLHMANTKFRNKQYIEIYSNIVHIYLYT